jgi:oligosaccharide repeat unit polymerase
MFEYSGRGYFFPGSIDLGIESCLYSAAFVLGYTTCQVFIFSSKQNKKYNSPKANKRVDSNNVSSSALTRLVRALKTLIFAKLMLLFYSISKVGIYAFYAGQGLADKISGYGEYNVQAGIDTVISSLEVSLTIALVSSYVVACKKSSTKTNSYLIWILILVFPLLSLQRSQFVFGVIFLLACNSSFQIRKLTLKKKLKKYFLSFLLLPSIFLVSTFVGNLRESSLGNGRNLLSMGDFLYGEFSTVIAYSEIKDLARDEGFTYGSTIFPPLLTKAMPRGWFPEKPLNSSATWMFKYRAKEARAGFFIAPSIFGDLYLNFGFFGALSLTLVLGVLAYLCDKIVFFEKTVSVMSAYSLVVYNSFYLVLRNNIADTAFSIFLAILMLYFVNLFVLNSKPARANARKSDVG